MKKFTKLFLSCAAVTAVTAAVATSAMAAEKTLEATYNEPTDPTAATTTVTIACDSQDEVKTLLILKPGSDKTNIKTENILQIDQAGAITTATIPALDEEKEEDKGTYTVLVGGTSGDIYMGTFSIGGTEILVGDANQDNDVTNNDAKLIMQVNAKINDFKDNGKLAADANQDGDVTNNDAKAIMQFNAKIFNEGNKEVKTKKVVAAK